jgi:hypothetical protein
MTATRINGNAGFTLAEMAMVLLIIALAVGGILAGAEMADNSKYRNVISQINKYNAAANTFKSKYGCLPGDCRHGVRNGFGNYSCELDAYHLSISPLPPYCGDGFIGGQYSGGYTYNGVSGTKDGVESLNFWKHLYESRILDENFPGKDATTTSAGYYTGLGATSLSRGTDFPATKLEYIGIWVSYNYFTKLTLAADPTGAGDRTIYNAFFLTTNPIAVNNASMPLNTPLENFRIDSKMDDGLPASGSVVIATRNSLQADKATDGSANTNYLAPFAYGNVPDGSTSTTVCANNGVTPPQYNVNNKSRVLTKGGAGCPLVVRATF